MFAAKQNFYATSSNFLVPSPPRLGAFGHTVAIDENGTTAIVGTNNGAVYIYNKIGSIWIQVASFFGTNLGQSVAINETGDIAVATEMYTSNTAVDVRIYKLTAGTWSLVQTITPGNSSSLSIMSVAITTKYASGVLAISSTGAVGSSLGGSLACYTLIGGIWTLSGTYGHGTYSDNYGISCDLTTNGTSGNVYIIVGATGLASARGGAYLHAYNYATSSLAIVGVLTPSDGSSGQQFGLSVAIGGINGSNILVGSPYRTVGGLTAAGSVYAFTFDGTTFSQTQIITASDPAANAIFGYSVSINGNTTVGNADRALVGCPRFDSGIGATYALIATPSASPTWTNYIKYQDPLYTTIIINPLYGSGIDVAINRNYGVVRTGISGSPNSSASALSVGAVYIYDNT